MGLHSHFRIRLVMMVAVLIVGFFALPSLVTAQDQPENVTHIVQRGDTLFRIALRYGIDMNELASANGITNTSRIFAGQVLTIPGLTVPDASPEIDNPLIAAPPMVHRVQRGENLAAIANRYGVTVQAILDANNLSNPNRILAGQELQIWSPELSTVGDTTEYVEPEPAAIVTETITHVVLPGESLGGIALRYGVPASRIMQDNNIANPNRILVGQQLTISGVEPAVAATEAPQEVAVEEVVIHTVQPGEHLSRIARSYGVPWTEVAEANGITDPNRVLAGMQLRIPNATQNFNDFGIITAEAAGHPGPRWGTGRELVVDLAAQRAYAYEDGRLMRAAIVSTGLPATPTVRGDYNVYIKRESQTMSGPGYSLPGVPWILYFYQGYGFHGTYWHNNFGQPMSRGCVNMTNEDAKWFYDFASIGTPVYVF